MPRLRAASKSVMIVVLMLFVVMAVMSGIDFKTIAEWLGHQDGGMLVGKVYGHLLPEHRQRMAERLVFAPVIFKASDESTRSAVAG